MADFFAFFRGVQIAGTFTFEQAASLARALASSTESIRVDLRPGVGEKTRWRVSVVGLEAGLAYLGDGPITLGEAEGLARWLEAFPPHLGGYARIQAAVLAACLLARGSGDAGADERLRTLSAAACESLIKWANPAL